MSAPRVCIWCGESATLAVTYRQLPWVAVRRDGSRGVTTFAACDGCDHWSTALDVIRIWPAVTRRDSTECDWAECVLPATEAATMTVDGPGAPCVTWTYRDGRPHLWTSALCRGHLEKLAVSPLWLAVVRVWRSR
jgi:hypothetical protein